MKIISFDAALEMHQFSAPGEEAPNEQMARLLAHLPGAIERELTDRQRQLLTMYFYENMNICQIADELHLNPSTVSRTLRRATQRLRRVLQYCV